MDTLRGHKEKVIAKLTGGLGQMAKMRKVTIVRGYGAFVGANHLEVEETTGTGQDKTGSKKVVAFKKAIIAAGSQAVRLPFMPDDPRVVDSTGALALQGVPQAHAHRGRRHHRPGNGHGVQHAGRPPGRGRNDGRPDAGRRPRPRQGLGEDEQANRFDNILLKTKTVGAQATPEGIQVQFEGLDGTQSPKVPTTWCCRPWAARPTARRSLPTRPACL